MIAVEASNRIIETRSISTETLLNVYLDTAVPEKWLPAVVLAFLLNESAVTIVENTIRVYEREGLVEIPDRHERFDQFIKAFAQGSSMLDFDI